MNETVERVKVLMADPEFVESLTRMEDNTEVQKAFAERGVELSLEDINTIAEVAFGSDGELDEAQLEGVAGGVAWEIIAIVAGGVKLTFDVLTEVNNQRKKKGKKPIW